MLSSALSHFQAVPPHIIEKKTTGSSRLSLSLMNEDPLSYTVWQPCLKLATSEEKQEHPASTPEKPRGRNLTGLVQATPFSWISYS